MRGRKPNLIMIKRVLELGEYKNEKGKKLSNVEIGRIVGCHEKQVRRWLKYPRTVIHS